MGRHRKKKANKQKQPERLRLQDIPRYEPELKVAEDIPEPEPEKARIPIPDRQPTRGESLRYYEYTIRG